ncbi:hypothetical protein NSB28_24235 [Murimonas intestini]|nr:hypothetical protein [Murimonas intestini]
MKAGPDGKPEWIFYLLESDWLIAEQLGIVHLYDCLKGKAVNSTGETGKVYVTHEMVDMEAFGEVKRKILEMKESLQFDENGGLKA